MNKETRERYIGVYERHENGETYVAIAKDLGISPTRASQLGGMGRRILRHEKIHAEEAMRRESLPVENPETIGDLNLSLRTFNRLRWIGINTITDLTAMTANELKGVINVDDYGQVIDRLEECGLSLRCDGEPKTIPTSVRRLGFSTRTYNRLWRAEIYDVEDLTAMTANELMKLWSFGTKSLEEVEAKLASLGLELRKEED